MTPDGKLMAATADEPAPATEAELEIVDEPELETFDHPELETSDEDEDEIPTRPTPKQELLAAAKRAAEVLHEHEIEPDTLAMLRAAIDRVENGSRRAREATTKLAGTSKQQAMIEMLSRDEGATIAEIATATGSGGRRPCG